MEKQLNYSSVFRLMYIRWICLYKGYFLFDACFISYQEHLNYVSEISQEEIFILDPELVVMAAVGTSPSTMPDLVNPTSSPVNSR